MTRQGFKDLYLALLDEECAKHPEAYAVDWRKETPAVRERWAGKVLDAIPSNGVALEGALKRLCRKVEIKSTYTALRAFVEGLTPDNGGQDG